MKIVIINANARKSGATARILNEFADILSVKGDVDIRQINLSDLRIDYCKGCCQCYKNGICHIADDAEMLSEIISEADGVIIGTPNYVSNVSGQLKTYIDRGHFVFEQLLNGKYTIGVVTYENAEGRAAFKVLKKLFVFSGAKTVDKIIAKIPFNSNPLLNKKVKSSIKNKADKLHRSIQTAATHSLSNKIMQFFVFNFGIKPFVLKKGDSYEGVLKHWEKRGIGTRISP